MSKTRSEEIARVTQQLAVATATLEVLEQAAEWGRQENGKAGRARATDPSPAGTTRNRGGAPVRGRDRPGRSQGRPSA